MKDTLGTLLLLGYVLGAFYWLTYHQWSGQDSIVWPFVLMWGRGV